MRRDPVSGAAPAPLLFDIPRSGRWYPGDFKPATSFDLVQASVSMYVEELYERVVDAGATWLYALFPNAYIDANRHETDFGPEQLAGPWTGHLEPTEKTRLGIGLIHSVAGRDRIPLYDRPLEVSDVRQRIDRYFLPYHGELGRVLAAYRETHGVSYHVSCHSMASIGGASTLDHGAQRSEFDIGDRHGTSCEPAFTALVCDTLRGFGYQVTNNFHYAGAESVRRHSKPGQGSHSLQIEIRRGLYMDEARSVPNAGFASLQAHLTELSRVLADYARSRAAAPSA
ncbi:hypothetical protein GT347_07305 [Xylophilus rhododendri]|uniref:N-formylglutamate amidohydrolase n=1 Tax=Xylophilus rhododendri TaxID=2697032 RepID=A0A857J4N8_9BURK|nr:N-formylglutamate amidohydrolase [Xylophilus rhododendri]QHI97815.1 hypothetical protein GT347_07305 [Xylophilus rhododendri]